MTYSEIVPPPRFTRRGGRWSRPRRFAFARSLVLTVDLKAKTIRYDIVAEGIEAPGTARLDSVSTESRNRPGSHPANGASSCVPFHDRHRDRLVRVRGVDVQHRPTPRHAHNIRITLGNRG